MLRSDTDLASDVSELKHAHNFAPVSSKRGLFKLANNRYSEFELDRSDEQNVRKLRSLLGGWKIRTILDVFEFYSHMLISVWARLFMVKSESVCCIREKKNND